jgi:hypothetical protein
MIAFDLQCSCGCQFEGWFESRADFEKQNSDDLIVCPDCGSGDIRKILSPVAIHSGPPLPGNPVTSTEPEISPEKVLGALRSIQNYLEKNFDDVGSKMAEESLKIHYGVIAPRNICGVATVEEEKMLRQEGIELLKFPMLKKSSDPKLH